MQMKPPETPEAATLSREFFTRETIEVARDLLGQILVRRWPDGRQVRAMIVETEAYLGTDDPACHTFEGRRSLRNESMYKLGGTSYVYFIYGMHHCFNVVTRHELDPEAVLIRAACPWPSTPSGRTWNGPAKLCGHLEIDRRLDGVDLTEKEGPLSIEAGPIKPSEGELDFGPRVGVAYAGDAAFWPLRFWLKAFAPQLPHLKLRSS